jgi:hypothetical protein
MKKTVEIWMFELGYFSKAECETLKEKVSGSYYNINVIYSNCCGNCSIGVTSDYDYENYDMTKEEFEKEVKIMFTRLVISALRDSYR